MPPPSLEVALAKLDLLLPDTFERITGIALPAQGRAQISLPLRFGGFGIHRSSNLAAAAFLTSYSQFMAIGKVALNVPVSCSFLSMEFGKAMAVLRSQAPPSSQQGVEWLTAQVGGGNFGLVPHIGRRYH